jgi:hypothetical protein
MDSKIPALDIIGDVHGHATKLEALLALLGYTKHSGVWSHRERRAVFIGDLIDRGPEQLETLHIARAMVEARSAEIVMGNHEFNAIAWATRDPSRPDDFLRTHDGEKGAKNRTQTARFLAAVGEDSPLHREFIDWFMSIPLWIDYGFLRVVHACWSTAAMRHLTAVLGPTRKMTPDFVVSSNTKGHPDYEAIETILKGPEIPLPNGFVYLDGEGTARSHARAKWWEDDADTYRSAALIPPGSNTPEGLDFPTLPDTRIDESIYAPYHDSTPLIVGHYWREGDPEVLHHRVACVDYSAGRGGPLTAYKWDGKSSLTKENFVSTP